MKKIAFLFIVPVMSAKNPFTEEIGRRGVTPEQLNVIFNDPEKRTWGNILGNGQDFPVHLHILNKYNWNISR